MVPLCRAAASTKAERGVRPRNNKTTGQHDWSPLVGDQLPGSPASVDPPNTENRSASRRIRRGEQRITATRSAATVSAFQRSQRFPLTSDFRPPWLAVANQRRRLTSGFTLIELVVVTLIIATLAAFILTAASGVLDRAKKTQAKNDLTQIVTAINAYYTEYGKYPVTVTSSTTDAFFGTGTALVGCTNYGTNDKLFNVLRNYTGGSDSANVTTLNPRQIVFISPKVSANARGGIGADNRYYDPWGTQYAVALDTTYNNALGTANPYSDTDGSAGPSPLQLGTIAYSYGKWRNWRRSRGRFRVRFRVGNRREV